MKKSKKTKNKIIYLTIIIIIISVLSININATYLNANNVAKIRFRTSQTLDGQVKRYDWNFNVIDDNTIKSDYVIYTTNEETIIFDIPKTIIKSLDLYYKIYFETETGQDFEENLTPAYIFKDSSNNSDNYLTTINNIYTGGTKDNYWKYLGNNTCEINVHLNNVSFNTNNIRIRTDFIFLSSYVWLYDLELKINDNTYKVITELNSAGDNLESAINEEKELEESVVADESEVENAIDEQSEAIETYLDRIQNPLQHGDYPFFMDGLWENQYINIWITIVMFFMLSSLIIFGRF